MKWSDRQEAIFDTYQNTRKNIVVEATAGASKTTCLVECCKRTPPNKRTLFMAFNKSIAEELKTRVSERIEVNTFHAKGLKTLLYNFKFKMKLNENKCFQISKKILDLKTVPSKQQARYLFELQDIWNALRINLLTDYEKDIPNICIDKDIEFRSRMIKDIQDIESLWMKEANRISNARNFVLDFTDMIYLPYKLLKSEDFSKYDVVFVDEAQDQNALQKEFVLRCVKPLGRLIIVGDKKQNIYQFTGSTVKNFEEYQARPNTVTLPLDITYRCSKAIVEEARKVFSEGIVAHDKAIDGIVREGDVREAEPGDFVLCRNNMPLIEAYIALLAKNKKATIKGRDFGNALCAVLEKIKSFEDLQILREEKIDQLMTEKKLTYIQAINNPSYINLEEKCAIIERLKDIWNDFKDLERNIKEIYTEDTESIVLSTIHKSKGLESDRVFFLNANLIPSSHINSQEALYSEYCLKFVAITRARKELIYCNI